MQDTVLIILASVVALIVIVVLLGLRYLRADDDDFDDIAEGRRSRTVSTVRERGRTQAYDDERLAGRAAPRAMRNGHAGGAQLDRRARAAQMVRPAAGAQVDRIERSGGWDRPRDFDSAPGQERLDRGQAPKRRNARQVHDDSGELVGAATQSGRSRGRVGRDEQAGRDERSGQDGGGRDGRGGPAWPREAGERRSAGVGGRAPEGWDARDPRDARDDRAGYRGGPDQRGTARHGAGSDDRRGAGGPSRRENHRREESLPDVRPRRGKREGEDNWPSTEWDELSDVDYWAELASGKPLPEAPQSAPTSSRAARTDSRRDTSPGAGRGRREDQPDRGSDRETAAKLPTRVARRHESAVRAAALPERMDQAGRADRAQRPGRLSDDLGALAPRRHAANAGDSSLAALADSGLHPPVPMPLNDDPLTSPSFPRVAADDSRSYRRNRTGPQPVQGPAGQQQYSGYPSGQFGGQQAVARPALPGPGHQGQSGVADPYQVAAQHAGLPGGYQQASAGYQGPASYQATTALPPHPSGPIGYPADPGPDGYLPQAAPPHYTSPPGYRSSPAGYPADPGSGSYQIPPAPSYGYDPGGPGNPPTRGGVNSPSLPGELPASYQGYPQPGITSNSGPHVRPPDNGYLPAAQPAAGYSVPGVPVAPQAPIGHMPPGSYPATPMYAAGAQGGQYQAAPYEPAAYQPATGHEIAGYPAGDPYALDPYGYTGPSAY